MTALYIRQAIDLPILDRGGLGSASCGCYAADKAAYARIMGWRAKVSIAVPGKVQDALVYRDIGINERWH